MAQQRPVSMVLGYHLIWTGYGWWLPNDPRGSTSRTIASDVIAELGALHYGRKPVQPAGWVIREFYERAETVLKHPLLQFTDEETQIIARSFADVIRANRYTCYACAIMPDHVHVLIRRHRDNAEEMIASLQEAARGSLQKITQPGHPIWGGPGWKVFLNDCDDIRRTIGYVETNPPKQRLSPQTWDFVTHYDGWPMKGRKQV